MIEVTARILQRCVFIPDEKINCEVIITNRGLDDKKNITEGKHTRHASDTKLIAPDVWNKNFNTSLKNESINVAWASAQIYCHCDINERRLKLPKSLRNHSDQAMQNTSFSPVMGIIFLFKLLEIRCTEVKISINSICGGEP